jgi:aminopeptidase
MADEANMSLEEYRDQIIQACYLDQENPIQKRKDTFSEINQIMEKLNNLNIQKVHVKSEDIDLEVKI